MASRLEPVIMELLNRVALNEDMSFSNYAVYDSTLTKIRCELGTFKESIRNGGSCMTGDAMESNYKSVVEYIAENLRIFPSLPEVMRS